MFLPGVSRLPGEARLAGASTLNLKQSVMATTTTTTTTHSEDLAQLVILFLPYVAPSAKVHRPERIQVHLQCKNLIKKPWAYNPQNSRIHTRNPNKGPRFLNQVRTLPHYHSDCPGPLPLLIARLQTCMPLDL